MKAGDSIEISSLKQPPDSERRETFEALIPPRGVLVPYPRKARGLKRVPLKGDCVQCRLTVLN